MFTNSSIRVPNVNRVERCASVIGGGLLAFAGLRAGPRKGVPMLISGSALLFRGITGRSYLYQMLGMRTASPGQGRNISVPYELGVRASAAVTINKPRPEVFAFWREFTNLPRFMRHLKEVQLTQDGRSHWVAEGPAGMKVEWDAEVVREIENELIGWRSLSGSQLDSAGSVQFRDAPGGRGTEILVEMQYNPPAGAAGAIIAKLFGRDAASEMAEDLDRLKQQLEAAEIATTEGQPQGGKALQRLSREERQCALTVGLEEVRA
jgi:uncharacterized membrane protein